MKILKDANEPQNVDQRILNAEGGSGTRRLALLFPSALCSSASRSTFAPFSESRTSTGCGKGTAMVSRVQFGLAVERPRMFGSMDWTLRLPVLAAVLTTPAPALSKVGRVPRAPGILSPWRPVRGRRGRAFILTCSRPLRIPARRQNAQGLWTQSTPPVAVCGSRAPAVSDAQEDLGRATA